MNQNTNTQLSNAINRNQMSGYLRDEGPQLGDLINDLLTMLDATRPEERAEYAYIGFDMKKVYAVMKSLSPAQRKVCCLWLLMRGPKVVSKDPSKDEAFGKANRVARAIQPAGVTFAQVGNVFGGLFADVTRRCMDVPIRAAPPNSQNIPRQMLWYVVQYLSIWPGCWGFQTIRALQMAKVYSTSPKVTDQTVDNVIKFLDLSRTDESRKFLFDLLPPNYEALEPTVQSQNTIVAYIQTLDLNSSVKTIPDFHDWGDLTFQNAPQPTFQI